MKKGIKEQVIHENLSNRPGIQRRDFIKLLGSGIFFFFYAGEIADLLALPQQQRRTLSKDFNAFLLIREDGTVNCYTGKIEMGQGPITSLAQELADELDVAYEQVKMVMGDTALCPFDQGTWGSLTTRAFGPYLRAAAAEARGVLLQMASEHLGIPVERLVVNDGIVRDTSDRSKFITYATLAKGKTIDRYLELKPAVKKPEEFRVMGKFFLRHDAREKVTGAAKYAADMRLPGMLYARILRPPSHAATLLSVDTSQAEKIPGIQVVKEGNFVAVLHEIPDRADEAIVKVKAEYSFEEKNVDDKTIFSYLLASASASTVVEKKGDLDTGKALSGKLTSSEFHNGYVAHSPVEPHAALAQVEGDKITIWASTQSPFGIQDSVAGEFGYSLENVRVITPFVGGGFGGKSTSSQAMEAARLARLTHKPVMVAWTRQEEFFFDTFRPAAVVKIISGTQAKGTISLWDYAQYFAGDRGSDTIYDVPHVCRTSYGRGWTAPEVHPFATGPWRAPGNNTNTFARESQIDIMAYKTGIDPLEFRLMNLKDEKMIAVLKAVAELFDYKPSKTPSGRGIGIACGIDAGTWVAHMAEVKVDKATGKIEVIRVACAQDMGMCMNPQGATLQIEGCITMGLGYALAEEIQFTGGIIHNRNFDSYYPPRFSWVPEIKTRILDRKDQPEQGGGEPAIICMGGVIANAVFDATGARLYQLPMTAERVLEALSKV